VAYGHGGRPGTVRKGVVIAVGDEFSDDDANAVTRSRSRNSSSLSHVSLIASGAANLREIEASDFT